MIFGVQDVHWSQDFRFPITAGRCLDLLDLAQKGAPSRWDASQMHILIAEDDTALAGFVRKGLDVEHYAVDVSNDGEQARAFNRTRVWPADSRSKPSALGGVNIVRRVRAEKPQATYPCINGTPTGRRR